MTKRYNINIERNAIESLRTCLSLLLDGRSYAQAEIFAPPPENVGYTYYTQRSKEMRILKHLQKLQLLVASQQSHSGRSNGTVFTVRDAKSFQEFLSDYNAVRRVAWSGVRPGQQVTPYMFFPSRRTLNVSSANIASAVLNKIQTEGGEQMQSLAESSEAASKETPKESDTSMEVATNEDSEEAEPPLLDGSNEPQSVLDGLNTLFQEHLDMTFMGFMGRFMKITNASGESLIYTRDAVDDLRKEVAQLSANVDTLTKKLVQVINAFGIKDDTETSGGGSK